MLVKMTWGGINHLYNIILIVKNIKNSLQTSLTETVDFKCQRAVEG